MSPKKALRSPQAYPFDVHLVEDDVMNEGESYMNWSRLSRASCDNDAPQARPNDLPRKTSNSKGLFLEAPPSEPSC